MSRIVIFTEDEGQEAIENLVGEAVNIQKVPLITSEFIEVVTRATSPILFRGTPTRDQLTLCEKMEIPVFNFDRVRITQSIISDTVGKPVQWIVPGDH